MAWLKVDDTSHAHPKFLRAGNAAIGLWVRAGAYVAQHLTEGVIPGVVAQLYGTAPQVRKLVAADLWHAYGHSCGGCPQPPAGDYVMHDYLTYNPTRSRVEDDRAAAADRQKRARDKAAERQKRAAEAGNQERNPPGSSRNGERIDEDPSTENGGQFENQLEFPDNIAGQGAPSHRDGSDPSRSPRPVPSPVPPTEVQQASYAGETTHAVPVNLRPLRDELTAAGIVVEWNLETADWFRLEAIAKRTAVAALVAHARGAVQRARSRPQSVRYFLPGWTALPPVPEGAPTSPTADVIPIGAGRPSTTDQRVAEGLSLAARLRAQEGSTA
ncbi:mucin-2 [Streptomyces sp. NPDC052069]|uniref:mucin-2 n=1 Tax=Streptomyces sp. NPDC052069 TaxID=3154650 RepID=UPI00341732BF